MHALIIWTAAIVAVLALVWYGAGNIPIMPPTESTEDTWDDSWYEEEE